MEFSQNYFRQHLGIKWPLILAPLGGGPSTPELVAAVTNSGGLGSFAAAYLPPGQIEEEVRRLRDLTSGPFAINLFAPSPPCRINPEQLKKALQITGKYRKELNLPEPNFAPPFAENFERQMDVILKIKPAVFSFTFGLVSPDIIRECRRLNILTMGTATTFEEGLALQNAGVNAVVAQGIEAGGHRGTFLKKQDSLLGTFALTRILSNLDIPVIAAGGIMDGQGIAAALALGADAVQLGTAFLLCKEAGTSTSYRQALLNSPHDSTRLTNAFSGRYARGIANRFMLEVEQDQDAILPFPLQNALTRDIRRKAAELQEPQFLSLWAGQGFKLIREMETEQLMHTLYSETSAAMKQLGRE
ncbi:nitronate monooxygenase [Legionella jordanis]|nr:nitronate monooxygenase [Legionella jordanis]RMX20795.1 nitronate monooxygenase [Legionella jordanis]